jgi:hypothetical protein
MITTHPEYPALKKQARDAAQKPIHIVLGETLETLHEDLGMETLTESTQLSFLLLSWGSWSTSEHRRVSLGRS